MTKEELEKENAELKMKIYGGGYEMIITKKDADIILLEKENAELKRRLDNLFNSDCWASDQLTKAKELLRRFIKWARTEHCEKFDVILEQAEQFIKEEK